MAISLLQDAQTRTLAAALAGMKRDDMEAHSALTMSPPMSANTSAHSLYPGLQHASAAFGMLSPSQLLAANRQAAAALMASQLFPQHPALFGQMWPSAMPHLQSALNASAHSPPASPHSPVGGGGTTAATTTAAALTPLTTTPSNAGKHGHHMLSPTSAAQCDVPLKKQRKIAVKKDLISPPMNEMSMNVSDLYSPSGPMSPPSSGSSPNSAHDGHHGGRSEATTNNNSATSHSAARDPSRDKSFTCKICSRSFGYKHVLQNHERTHTGEKPFECPECHKRFTRDHHLKTHMRLHTGEKPYHCSHCDRQFVQVANLRRHLRVHTGERPYACEICDGKFSDSNQLKSHMLVHNGEKPFDCPECHTKFRRRHHLLNHKCGQQNPIAGLHSPPTSPDAALSPGGGGGLMGNEYAALCDQKSVMGSSYGSEESMDVGRPMNVSNAYDYQQSNNNNSHLHSLHNTTIEAASADDEDEEDAPLDLSESDMSIDVGRNSVKGIGVPEFRHVFRLPTQMLPMHAEVPEQTEPEDLSIHRNNNNNNSITAVHAAVSAAHSPESMTMMHDDLDLDELDDAAMQYMRQQQQHQHQLQQQHFHHHLSTLKHPMKME